MAIPQQKFREVVFLILYSHDIAQGETGASESLVMQQLEITRKTYKEAEGRVKKILEHLPLIDPVLERISTSYQFDRIQRVERNLLRLGAYELLYDSNVPPKVAIAESIRLARKFSTPAAGHFVNAILDNIYRESEGQPIDRESIVKSSEALADDETTKEPPLLT